MARKRFEALGLDDIVKVICMDARQFRIEQFEPGRKSKGVDWITMSYSLSMIPE